MSRFDGWMVFDVRGSNKMGWYYALNVVGAGGATSLVTVKLSRHGRHVCLTCNKADACEHARFVSAVIDRDGIPEEK